MDDRPVISSLELPDLEHIEATETVHHKGVGKKRLPRKMPELNVVPMLDVCFNLLIFFVMTASFALGEGVLPADLPVGQGNRADDTLAPQQPITIMLRALGGQEIAIEVVGRTGAVASFEDLYRTVAGMQRTNSNPNGLYAANDPVIIKPEGNIRWEAIIGAFNAVIRAQYTNVNFAQAAKP